MAYIKLKDGTVKQVDDNEFKALIMAKAGEETDAPQSQGYDYTSPDDYTDLYNNAKMVGYSGLDDAQKALFAKAYPLSKAAQSGMSLDDAIKATDAGAKYQTTPAAIGQGYNNAYDKNGRVDITNSDLPMATKAAEYARVPGAIIAGGLASVLSGIQSALVNRDMGLNGALSAGWESAKDQAIPSYDKGILGQDGEGMVADPTNFIPFAGKILGSAPKVAPLISKATNLVSNLPLVDKISSFISNKELPSLVNTAINVVKPVAYGAGYNVASDIANPSTQVDPSKLGHDALVGSAIGGGLGVGGKITKGLGLYYMPNRNMYGEQLGKLGVKDPGKVAETNISNLLDQTSFPINQDKLIAQNEANRVAAGQGMNDALSSVDRNLPYNQPDYTSTPGYDEAARYNLAPVKATEAPNIMTSLPAGYDEANNQLPDNINMFGQYVQKSWPHSSLPGIEINNPESKWFIGKNDWEDIAKNAHENHNIGQTREATKTDEEAVHKLIDKKIANLQSKVNYNAPEIREGEFQTYTINPDRTITPNPLSRVDRVETLAKMKHAVSSQYVPKTDDEIAGREADDAIHDAIENRLEEIPGYKELAAKHKRDYSIAKGLGRYLQAAPRISSEGFARKIPLVNTYGGAGNVYKLGQIMQSPYMLPYVGIARGLGGSIYDGWNHNR